jgi:hypothetical protein
MLAVTGKRKRRSTATTKSAEGLGQRRRPRKTGNGRLTQRWTRFPWQADRVTEIAAKLLDGGEKDPDRLTLAVAKTVYPVHPITGQSFDWQAEISKTERDPGIEMVWRRIRLRVNTLVAADEERVADQATSQKRSAETVTTEEVVEESVESESEESDEDEGEDEKETPSPDTHEGEEADEEGDDEESDSTKETSSASPVIARYAPPPTVETFVGPQRPALTLKRGARRHPRIDSHALHPRDNHLGDGLFHTVAPGETIHAIAQEVLEAKVSEPSDEQVASYVSLIVCSPYNRIPVSWDDEHDLPGSVPYPWGASTPTLWLPKLNDDSLARSVVTTLGVTWSDGSNGITPPPEMVPRP